MDPRVQTGEVGLATGDEALDNGATENLPPQVPVNPGNNGESSIVRELDASFPHNEAGPSHHSPVTFDGPNVRLPIPISEPSNVSLGFGTDENTRFPTVGELNAREWADPPTYEAGGRRQETSPRYESEYTSSLPSRNVQTLTRENGRNSNLASHTPMWQGSSNSSQSRNDNRTSRSNEDENNSSTRTSNIRSTLDALEGLSFSAGSGEPGRTTTNNQISSRRSSNTRHSPSRSPLGEIIIPRWQPDAEVTFCPISSTIAIEGQLPSNVRNSSMPIGFTGLGGGARVRLCNPCVPDPNVAPPHTPQSSARLHPSGQPGYHNRSTTSANVLYGNYGNMETPSSNQPMYPNSSSQVSTRQNRPTSLSHSSSQTSLEETIRSLYRVDLRADVDHSSSSTQRNNTIPRPARSSSRATYSYASTGPSLNAQSQLPPASNNAQHLYRSHIDDSQRPLPPVPQIAEDDECPVCHRELPSRTLPDFETLRENHIKDCVEEQLAANSNHASRPEANNTTSHTLNTRPYEEVSQLSSSNPTNSSIPTHHQPSYDSGAAGRRRGVSSATSLASSSTAAVNTPESRAAARERAHAAVVLGASRSPQRGRRSGVFPYNATEKDCIDDAECTICMEEYEVGVEMGRLECFCRFHLHCIQEWFETHPGQCPVHGMDG
ncbi:hypothetical protein B7463_g10680, partial [Scytalidium lignicola]